MLSDLEKTLKAAADETRLRILKMLETGPLCVCQIVEALGLSQSTVSKHLSVLEGAGLVSDERRGKWTFYRLGKPATAKARKLLALVRACAKEDPRVAKDLANLASAKARSLPRCGPPRQIERRVTA